MISAYILYDGTAHSYLHAHAHTHYNNWIKLKKIFWIIVFLWWPKFISEYQRNRKAPVWRGSNFFFWKVDCILCYSITSILSPSENASIKLKLHAYKKKLLSSHRTVKIPTTRLFYKRIYFFKAKNLSQWAVQMNWFISVRWAIPSLSLEFCPSLCLEDRK